MLCYFYAFQQNIDRTTAVPSLLLVYVCLSGCMVLCISVVLCIRCVCVRVCLSVCMVLCRGVCVFVGA